VGGPGSIPRPTSGGSGTCPSSGGAGTRPLSAESQAQQSPDSVSSGAWGARPSLASGVLGQAQPQLAQAQAQARPRSVDITSPNRSLFEFGDQSGSHSLLGNAAWGNRGPPSEAGGGASQGFALPVDEDGFSYVGFREESRPSSAAQQPRR
jgi:hypothetical protein